MCWYEMYVHGVATCTSSKALSELNIASNSEEVSPNRRGGSFSFDQMSADPESSTGKFSLPVPSPSSAGRFMAEAT
jgi:hypothetical protein